MAKKTYGVLDVLILSTFAVTVPLALVVSFPQGYEHGQTVLVDQIRNAPFDTFLGMMFVIVCLAAIRISLSGRYIYPTYSSALWSLVTVGAVFIGGALALPFSEYSLITFQNPYCAALLVLALITISAVTHKYTG